MVYYSLYWKYHSIVLYLVYPIFLIPFMLMALFLRCRIFSLFLTFFFFFFLTFLNGTKCEVFLKNISSLLPYSTLNLRSSLCQEIYFPFFSNILIILKFLSLKFQTYTQIERFSFFFFSLSGIYLYYLDINTSSLHLS